MRVSLYDAILATSPFKGEGCILGKALLTSPRDISNIYDGRTL